MTVGDSLYYLTLGNPLSKYVIGGTSGIVRKISGTAGNGTVKSTVKPVHVDSNTVQSLWRLAGNHSYFVRFGGLCGASAVILGAYGNHRINTAQDKGEAKAIFDRANSFHFIHSIAMMAVPLTHYPVLTGSLMVTGTLLFSGILYYRALTGDKQYSRFAPYGGTCLILAWLSMML